MLLSLLLESVLKLRVQLCLLLLLSQGLLLVLPQSLLQSFLRAEHRFLQDSFGLFRAFLTNLLRSLQLLGGLFAMLRQGLRLRLEVLLRDDLVGRQGLAGAGHHGRGLLLVVFQSQGCLLTLGLQLLRHSVSFCEHRLVHLLLGAQERRGRLLQALAQLLSQRALRRRHRRRRRHKGPRHLLLVGVQGLGDQPEGLGGVALVIVQGLCGFGICSRLCCLAFLHLLLQGTQRALQGRELLGGFPGLCCLPFLQLLLRGSQRTSQGRDLLAAFSRLLRLSFLHLLLRSAQRGSQSRKLLRDFGRLCRLTLLRLLSQRIQRRLQGRDVLGHFGGLRCLAFLQLLRRSTEGILQCRDLLCGLGGLCRLTFFCFLLRGRQGIPQGRDLLGG
mmetsp:Transcript_34736/g.71391  ORF Transcript_34736/g.71391 Transcript_34736/m.71391 type:complete len:386 (+) Transcript_34736:689-1846(+)